MVAIPLLPTGAQQGIAAFQEEVRYIFGREQRPPEPNALAFDSTPDPVLPQATPTPEPPKRATPTPLSEDLIQMALRRINQDRDAHDVPPVILGSNPAAQLHAEDMLEHNYLGHWWVDGRKPYMVYTQTGGTSYVSENVASIGWTDREWEERGCDSALVRCGVSSPVSAISEMHQFMVYNDAHADWGHRDNILGKRHRAVNIGIGTNGKRVTLVQHFEGGAAVASAPPALSSNNRLSLEVEKREPGLRIGEVVTVYYDSPPAAQTPRDIDRLDSYCLGGSFTAQCGEPVASIFAPPPPGYSYPALQTYEVVARSWRETDSRFTFQADMGTRLNKSGVYTVVVWRDSGGATLDEVLVELSLFAE